MPLATLAAACAPTVAPRTTLAIMTVESGGKPWVIDDDTAVQSYQFSTRAEAVVVAKRLLAQGHNLDVGLMQLNSSNFVGLGLNVAEAFDPCTNIWAGSRILMSAYANARARYGPGMVALYHAFEVYNSGHVDGARRYAIAVWQAGLR